MKRIQKTTLENSLIVFALICTVVGGVVIYMNTRPPLPVFSYDASSVDGWWGSQNINVQKTAGSDYTGEVPKNKLPVADLTIHHGTAGSNDTPEDSCFTMASYFNYSLASTDSAYTEYENSKTDGTLIKLELVERTFETYEGEKTYELRRYNYTIEGQDVLSGYQIGFIPMSSGYIRTEGVCKTSDDLPLIDEVQPALRLNEH